MTASHHVRRHCHALTYCIGMTILSIGGSLSAQPAAPLELAQTIILPEVHGRIDHLDLDVPGERLFIAALGNNTLEIVDLRTGKRVERVTALQEPQGVLYVPEQQRLFVASGQGASVHVFAGSPAREIARAVGLEDADNLRYERNSGNVYAGYGSAIAVISGNAQLLGRIDLPGHPESFQLESAGPRMFVNVPSARQIAVIDRNKRAVIGTWPLKDVGANFPMALDEQQHRLFVATRRPAAVLAYDTQSGKRVAKLASSGDADDLFYDPARKRIYVVCGEGFVDVVQQRDPDHYDLLNRVKTAAGARTGLFAPAQGAIYVAVPAGGRSSAEIRVYTLK